MTMPCSPGRALFEGNGTATDFPFSFKVWGTEQLSVTLTGPDGNSRPASGWNARLDDDGGSVTYLHDGAPLPAGWKLAITRNMPFEQQIDLVSGTRFDAEVIETALDKATAERQQLLEQLRRAVILPPTSDGTPEDMAQELLRARDEAVKSAGAAKNSEQAAADSASDADDSEQAAATSAEAADQSRAEAAASAAAASQSATAARQSAEAAAGSEGRAAQSAASILGLQVEVTTLDPGLPASGGYDPETGILHLGIPKGDAGASAIATPTSPGSVMPQTGDEDGLELEADGKLRVRKATPTQRGSVLASMTAAASAVPQAGEDGTLDASWTANCLHLSGGTLTGAVAEALQAVTGEAVVLDLKAANNFTHAVAADTTFTVMAHDGSSFQLGTLVLTNGGAFTVTWPDSFKWADGVPPALTAEGVDVITFFTVDGGNTCYAVHVMTGVA
ncbi:hypothetical protein [uncultured Desulfovibrio sp.]|uniref:hypothetical protein n=1 Tax=uncultured Desulfovibrio sp. TaxID=167968 RepID=UPI00265D0FB6|nr:hypothetical protein [uncultured Desulfovibrio sp.]